VTEVSFLCNGTLHILTSVVKIDPGEDAFAIPFVAVASTQENLSTTQLIVSGDWLIARKPRRLFITTADAQPLRHIQLEQL
jgi:hypothetical protein